ncbi:MAG: hypothetical protein KAS12_04225 [Candidatus Aenigmarchaeota archaeon]|nr:hypothetical protein [Candidatus Aenigmarchaeota archaeon]
MGEIYILIEGKFIQTSKYIFKIGYSTEELLRSTILALHSHGSKILYQQYIQCTSECKTCDVSSTQHETCDVSNTQRETCDVSSTQNEFENIQKKIFFILSRKFKHRPDVGINYFEGYLVDIILEILPIINNNQTEIRKNLPKIYGDRFFKYNYISTNNSALMEACEKNIFQEYGKLDYFVKNEKFSSQKQKLYHTARYLILDYIITYIKNDPINANYGNNYSDQRDKIVDAGNMLNEEGGKDSMNDFLVWSFIPKRYHREIDNFWDGIGRWLS